MTELKAVRQAAVRAAASREDLEVAIRAAHEKGAALRVIAEAAGWSHEQVRRIVSR